MRPIGYRVIPVYEGEGDFEFSVEKIDELRSRKWIDNFLKALEKKLPEYACRGPTSVEHPMFWDEEPSQLRQMSASRQAWRGRWTISFNVGVAMAASFRLDEGFMFYEPLTEDEHCEGKDPFGKMVLNTADIDKAVEFCLSHVPDRYWPKEKAPE